MLGKMSGNLPRTVRRLFVAVSVCAAVAFMAAAPASAQTYTGVPPPNLGAGTASVASQPAGTQSLRVASTPASRGATAPVGGLALTGADIAGLVVIGGVLILFGSLITRNARARSAS